MNEVECWLLTFSRCVCFFFHFREKILYNMHFWSMVDVAVSGGVWMPELR